MKIHIGMRKGITLIFALIILLLLALLAAAIMMLSMNEGKIVGAKIDNLRCLSYAKAGVSEVIHRLSLDSDDSLYIGDSSVPYESLWKVYILMDDEVPEDNPPVYYKSSIQMVLPEEKRLEYSTENPQRKYSLIVHHKVNPKTAGEIFFYNWVDSSEVSRKPEEYKGAFLPIEVVESVGIAGGNHRKVKVEVVRKSPPLSLTAALCCNCDIEIAKGFVFCGHNHIYETPGGTDARGNPFECFALQMKSDETRWHIQRSDRLPHARETDDYEKENPDLMCSADGCVPGISTAGHTIDMAESSFTRGNPDIITNPKVSVFIPLYKMLGTESPDELDEKYAWKAIGPGKISSGSYKGLYKCKGDLELSGITNFEGILWVTGKIKQEGSFSCKGLVYANKELEFNGDIWVLGGVAIDGERNKVSCRFRGSGAVLYSSRAIERAIASSSVYGVILRKEE